MYIRKILLIFSGILCFLTSLGAKSFVFNNDNIVTPKSIDFIEQTSSELFAKTGVNLYIYTANATNKNYDEFKSELILELSSPYVAIVLLKDNKKIDIITSDNNLLDKKKVYWEYMVPLLPQKDNELTNEALSAVVFNGYVESVDLIADRFGVKIEHNIPKNENGAKAVAKAILYIMLFSMIGLFVIMYFLKKE